ncbi:MAG TPA: T9SS type A sorting domain-containing protein, partial [Chitinophagales bacterium]|nr:T9SS type A sorting domain-containing protein [Chitinophagales bacterium]
IDSTYYWLHDPQFFYNGNSFNEINGKYVVGIPKYNQQCIGQNLDPNCGISISNFSIHAYTLEANGILIKQDTFSFNNTYTNDNNFMSYASQIAISDIIPTSNGYRFRLYNYYQNPSQNFSIYITDYNTLTNTASAVNKINYVKDNPYGLLISNPHLKKGFIFSNSSSFNFYNFNSTYSSATLNQNSVKPIPDSFYMYYPNRFQKTIDYRTTWIDENIDTSYLLLGKITLKDSGTFLSIIQLSNSFGVYTGNVYKDNNNNCSFDTITDTPYKYRTVEVTKTDAPLPYKYYDFTDANGKFEIFADTGNFSAKVFPNSDLWSACPSVHNFSLNNANDTVIQNFYLQRLLNCPKLSVSIATDRLRSCIDNSYYINYCNRGTADAVDAYVQVTFDSALIVNSASLPYTHVGNVYSFQVGTIKEDSCGQFIVSTTLNCSTPLGITHCVTAHIYPDSLCATVDPRWDRSNVAVDGKCLGDSVLFRIRNIGTGNMSVPKQYIVIEDNVLRIIPINFQLNAGQELLIKRPANGTTQRLVAEQTDYFPYPSHPTAVVENCGGLNAGFVNQFPNDDAADFIAVNCTQNIGSFDPNDKNGIPEGINTEHLIEKNTDIDYRIRFQNTGTDTAYDVYILDTLSPKLDVATLQMGAASHAYRYEIYGDGHAILKVVFPGINLVDSFKNEPLSHGFFTYRISQDSTNEKGDIIYNAADIYFDSNQPVKTNTTVHTITDVLFSIISTVIENKWQVSVSAYPNPFRDKCTIEINTKNSINGVFHFSLFNLSGQLIEEQYVRDKVEVAANNLSDNIYLYRIEYAGDLVSAGKIIKN